MEYGEILHDAWHALGDFNTIPNQTQIENMFKEAQEEKKDLIKKYKKIKTTLLLGVLSIAVALFIIFTDIHIDLMHSPQFILSVIFVLLVVYHMFTLIVAEWSLKKNIVKQESIIKMVSPEKDKILLEKIYAFSHKNEEVAHYLEEVRGRMLTQTEVLAIDTVRKKVLKIND